MTALDDIADVERPVMHDAAQPLGLDTSGSRLVSASSRLIWHLPVDQVALAITRPGSKTTDDIAAEVAAVRSVTAGGVRTPPLLAEPIELAHSCFALPYRWVDGRAFESADWPAGVAEVAKLARCHPEGLRLLAWPTNWPDPAWKTVLGRTLFAEFSVHVHHAKQALSNLLSRHNPVLCHGDVQPANFLMDQTNNPWLIDLEHACLAPPGWDAAKIVLLSNRFGDPASPAVILDSWPSASAHCLETQTKAQEIQIVSWLLEMTGHGTLGAGQEARFRAVSLADPRRHWRHLTAT